MTDALNLFAGARGWEVGAPEIDMHGLELDDDANATAKAAGFHGHKADVRTTDPLRWLGVAGLVASPPCPSFSTAGKGLGKLDMPRLERGLALMQERGELYGKVLATLGYRGAAANLHAEQYGVPQTRKRAILVANREHVVALPTPTHQRHRRPDSSLLPCVSMAEVLGIENFVQRGNYSTGGGVGSRAAELHRTIRDETEPSVTITRRMPTFVDKDFARANAAVTGSWGKHSAMIRAAVEQAGLLQSFPAGYPWQGGVTARKLQVGNAIPPLLAGAILRAVTE